MDFVFNFFNQGWVGAVIGILGVFIAVYTYHKTKIGPRLVYQMDSLKIIGKNEVTPEEITIYYKGIKVPRIIKTSIVLWNSGTKTIDGKNIVKNDPIRLEFSENEEIIGASILNRTKEVNQFEITNNSEKRNILNIDFEYLDPQDGVRIEILHTDIKRYPTFKGNIKGMPKGALNWGRRSSENIFTKALSKSMDLIFLKNGLLWMLLIVGIGTTSFSVIVPTYFEDTAKKLIESNNASNLSFFSSLLFIGITYLIIPLLFLWNSRKRYPKLLKVEKLESDMDTTTSNYKNFKET